MRPASAPFPVVPPRSARRPAPGVRRNPGTATAGIVLVLVSALLTLLILIAMAAVRLAASDRDLTRSLVDRAHARLLAASGIEYAGARLRSDPEPRPGATSYADDWTYRDLPDVPIERALNPSYSAGDRYTDAGAPSGNNRYVPGEDTVTLDRDGDGRYGTWSGRLRGLSKRFSSRFVLRIEDESAKINVNGGFVDTQNRDADAFPDHRDPAVGVDPATPSQTGRGWNAQLRRILDLLGTAREDADGDGTLDPGEDWDADGFLDPPPIGVTDLGRILLERRPTGGYATIGSAEEAVKAATNLRVDLSPYVTVSSWTDRAVVRPNAHPAQTSTIDTSFSHMKMWRAALRPEEGGRPPVNLNAASRAVLAALLTDLRGLVGSYRMSAPRTYQIDGTMASAVAAEMVARRPYATWTEFSDFCDSLVPTVIQGMNAGPYTPLPGSGSYADEGAGNLGGADLLKANFDPNTRLNKGLPDQVFFRWMDKSDLLTWSTEGSLGPTGIFGVESLGRVYDVNGAQASSSLQWILFESFSLARHTTQADFVGGRTLADTPRWLSGATAGPATHGAALGWGGAGAGLATVTYPCPVPALPARAADFDGAVALASVTTGGGAPPGGTLQFLQRFDDSWDADVGSSTGVLDTEYSPILQLDLAESVWPNGAEPNTVYPDGVHSQWLHMPAYGTLGNLPENGRHGAVSIWVKRRYASIYSFPFVSVRRAPLPSGIMESLCLAMALEYDAGGFLVEGAPGADFGIGAGAYERIYKRLSLGASPHPGLRWRLLTGVWDTDDQVLGQDAYFQCPGFEGDGTPDPTKGGAYGGLFDPSISDDLTDADAFFTVGCSIPSIPPSRNGDFLADELAICDFGDDGAVALAAAQAWADARFADGRYYKGNDGSFLSPPVAPAGGPPVRVREVRWTAILPQDERPVFAGNPIPDAWSPRPRDGRLSNFAVDLEIVDAAGAPLAPPVRPAQGQEIDVRLPSFRYRVTFSPNLADPLNDPVLETAFLDDVTLVLQRTGPPRLLRWAQE